MASACPASGTGKRPAKGSILIFTLWVLTIVSLFSLAVGFQVRQRLRYLQSIEIRYQLRQLADAGLRKAVNIVIDTEGRPEGVKFWADNPEAFREVRLGAGTYTVGYMPPDDEAFRYGVEDEGSKIDLNTSPAGRLTRLFRQAGMADRAGDMAASIKDWIDEDDHLNAGGAEKRYYSMQTPPYRPRNRNMESVEELLLIKGMTQELYQKVLPWVTIYGTGKVNINTASHEVLKAFRLSDAMIAQIDRFLEGKDGRRGTPDDRFFADPGEAAAYLGGSGRLTASEQKSFEDFVGSGALDVTTLVFRARVLARLAHRKETLKMDCVFNLAGNIQGCTEIYQRAADDGNRGDS